MFKIILKDAEGGEAQFPLTGRIIIGRDQRCQIILNDNKVSRKHASIELKELNQAVVRDLKSSNGTYVNGKKIEGECRVNAGDTIAVGINKLRILETNPLNDFASTTQVGTREDDWQDEKNPAIRNKPIPSKSSFKKTGSSMSQVSVKVVKPDFGYRLLLFFSAAIAGGILLYYILFQ